MASTLPDHPYLDFAVKLHKQLVSQSDRRENILYSPLSISAALSMMLAGARGKTATELRAVLRSQDSCIFYRHFDGLFSNDASATDGVKVHSANRIYCDQAFPVLHSYRSLLWDTYGAAIESVDFREDFENVRQRINSWIENVTESKIKGYLCPESLDALTTMILVSAVHIKGFWECQFSPTKTISSCFFGSKAIREAFMMNQMGQYKTASCDDLNVRAVEIPYRGGKSTMVVILPNERNGLFALEKRLTAPKLGHLLKNLCYRGDVFLYLPKFKLEQAVDFKVTLQGIGIKDLFTPEADLSDISEAANLFPTGLFHKVVLEVNEDGKEVHPAYAVTMMFKQATLLNLNCQFVVDRPFMFLVLRADRGRKGLTPPLDTYIFQVATTRLGNISNST
ncbi:hypothetical protein V5799_026320 [Amblyomma americanum]|uniref:Serpin domain-containing protein n=1 Tax=Amblyomma americanum TaxID=6943 RepID=A0AAQ4DIX0_AMBAM